MITILYRDTCWQAIPEDNTTNTGPENQNFDGIHIPLTNRIGGFLAVFGTQIRKRNVTILLGSKKLLPAPFGSAYV